MKAYNECSAFVVRKNFVLTTGALVHKASCNQFSWNAIDNQFCHSQHWPWQALCTPLLWHDNVCQATDHPRRSYHFFSQGFSNRLQNADALDLEIQSVVDLFHAACVLFVTCTGKCELPSISVWYDKLARPRQVKPSWWLSKAVLSGKRQEQLVMVVS